MGWEMEKKVKESKSVEIVRLLFLLNKFSIQILLIEKIHIKEFYPFNGGPNSKLN